MRTIYYYIIFIFIVNLITSCEDSYYVDINDVVKDNKEIANEIVINGSITSEKKYHEVTITKPIDLNNNIFDSIKGAKVQLQIGDKVYNYIEEYYHPYIKKDNKRYGTYISTDSICGIPGHSHTLIVDYKGKIYTATDIMPYISSFDFSSIELPYITESKVIDGNEEYNILGLDGIKFGCSYSAFFNWIAIDSFGNSDIDRVYYFSFIEQQPSNGEIHLDFTNNDVIMIEKHSISEKYENYIHTLFKETYWNTSLFSTIPANLPTNVSNGGLGFFYASAVYKQAITGRNLRELIKSRN